MLTESRAVDEQPTTLLTIVMSRAARKMAGERLHVVEFALAALAARVLGRVPAVLRQSVFMGEVPVAGIAVVAHIISGELCVRIVVQRAKG